MRLKVFRADSMADALRQARASLGPDALILSTRRAGGLVEVTAAVEPEAEPQLPLEQCGPGQLQTHPALGWHGVPAPISERLRRGDLARELSTIVSFGSLPLAADGPPLALLGVPGAGKTLTLAKLVTRLVLQGAQPLVITADGRRAGAAEELAAYTRLLGLALVVASHPATLAKALKRRQPGSAVLIDTGGVNPFDSAQMEGLDALLRASGAQPVLVTAAGLDALEAAEHATCFRPLGARHLIVTRLDMARRLGGVLAACVAGALTVTEGGTGTGVSGTLAPLTPDALAARLGVVPAPVRVPAGHDPRKEAEAHDIG